MDHAGTTLTSKRLMDRFHSDMVSNLYGNPHSFSQASHRTAEVIDGVRFKLLASFNADPQDFDVVFTANATAAIKLVADAFRDLDGGFEFAYHNEAHTSLVGARELAQRSTCLATDDEAESWLEVEGNGHGKSQQRTLFAYPAQSNLNGRRLPLQWCERLRHGCGVDRSCTAFSLLDAAAYVSTSPLDLSDVKSAPDFVALSLYKIFGFPDLGALIVRRESAFILDSRRYFGGGTTEMVINRMERSEDGSCHSYHIKKTTSIHEKLEDGTLPYHSIAALSAALITHDELFGSLERIATHTQFLARQLFNGLTALKHGNGRPVIEPYSQHGKEDTVVSKQGPIVAFNLRSAKGTFVSLYEFEKLAFARNVNIRTGGLCNPGGTASFLNLTSDDLQANFDEGHRCGGESDIINGRPTGMIRASLGAMSTMSDVKRFVSFISEFFVEKSAPRDGSYLSPSSTSNLHVESLTVYPIKSCAGWRVPDGVSWPIRPEGLAWDREWCVTHAITGKALSQKRHPRMALIRPELDVKNMLMRVSGLHLTRQTPVSIEVPLKPLLISDCLDGRAGEVCGTVCDMTYYDSSIINSFFTDCIGVPCRLARFPDSSTTSSRRHAKDHLNRGLQGLGRSIVFSNESPILTITRASLNRLNETIKRQNGKAASPAVFRANIVLANAEHSRPGEELPFAEDDWMGMRIGEHSFDFLGGCRRCQMVCIDQTTGERNEEPFSTLAKTRRVNGRVLFGVHTALAEHVVGAVSVTMGDVVTTVERP